MRGVWAALAAAAVVAGGAGEAAAEVQTQPDDVDEVIVRARPLDWLLSITIGGDVSEKSFVSSGPLGIVCGPEYYRFERARQARQCWMRVRFAQEVSLTVTDEGVFGRDWTVDWTGCQPQGNGALCTIEPRREDQVVAVIFRRLR